MKSVTLLCAALLSVSAASAQTSANKGTVAGTVIDASGAIVSNARVTITNTSTGFMRQAPVNDTGQYQFLRLDPGSYTLTGTAASFATSTVEGILLEVGSSITVNLTLQAQATTTTIDVSATLIESGEPAPSTSIDRDTIFNLPINGRRFQEFATLTPTVQIDPERGTLSFAGQRGVNGNVVLDGADYNNPFFGGIRGGERANLVPTVPQSAVEQFEVVTTGYSAEYGRSSGGMLNVVTRSGTNEFHGNAFWQYRSGDMAAREPIFHLKSGETQHQFGGAVGGPIKKEKLFFFGAIERQLNQAPRAVVFNRLIGVTPDATNQEAFNFYKQQEQPFQLTNDATVLTSKLDYQTASGDRLTLRYNFSDANGQNAVNTGGALNPNTNRAVANDGIEKDRTHTGTLEYTHLFSPALLNDLRFNGTYELRPRLANSTQPNVGNIIGNTGNRNFLPTTESDKRLQITDSISWNKNNHTVKLGLDYNFVTAGQTFGFNQFGTFSFSVPGSNTQATLDTLDIMSLGGASMNRFDSPYVTSYSLQIGNLLANMHMHQTALYAQDSWRATRDLTLDFGVRWEGQFNPQPEATNAALVNMVKGVRSPVGAVMDPTKIPNSPNQWMPRFGFAWSPSGVGRRIVVRGHTGLFYAASPMLLFADAVNNFRATPGNLSVTLRPTDTMSIYDQFKSVGVDLNQSSLDNLPVLSVDQVTQAFANANGVAPDPFAGASLGFVGTDFRNPRSFQIGLGTDVQLTSNLIASIQFNYVNTVHLQRNRDYNLPFADGVDGAGRPFYGLRSRPRPIPTLGNFTVRESSARSMYRGVTFKIEHRGSKLTAGAFYTLSDTFSDDDNERDATGYNAQDMFNFKPDYGYSRMDLRHQFNSYAVYTLPGGFQITGSFVVRSGWPINPTASGDPNQDFSTFSDRPYQAIGVPFTRDSFRNRSVVTANNMRVLKSFNLTETAKVQISAEFFNLFNIDNVVYGSNFGDSTYGLGIDPTTGATVAPLSTFMQLRNPDGSYYTSNRQDGKPFQAQFGARFFF